MTESPANDILVLTAGIVSAHISNTPTDTAGLRALIEAVYRSLSTVGNIVVPPTPQTPAVAWKKSVFPEFIICLEDGKKLKMLRRHLHTRYGMTPDQYRAKWDMPATYPMLAPSYASHRSTLAKSIGLGRKRAPESAVTIVPARRARGSKS